MPVTTSTEPQIIKMPAQKMAVVQTVGDPSVVGQKVFPALYGSVYTLKFEMKKKGKDFKVGAPRARWPNAHLVPKNKWIGIWGLPIPSDVRALPQRVAGIQVKIEKWNYGAVAQILHVGPYKDEMPTVQRLHKFVMDSGYRIAGPHEEEYLTRPTARVIKTIIRYEVKKK